MGGFFFEFEAVRTPRCSAQALKAIMTAHGGVVPLPMIKNKKTVDPKDDSSTPVFQLETAMGAAIECFKGATARSRRPVVLWCFPFIVMRRLRE